MKMKKLELPFDVATFDKCLVYYEKDGTGFTGKVFAVLWLGQSRYIGMSICARNITMNKNILRHVAIMRAYKRFEDGRVRSFISRKDNPTLYAKWARFSEIYLESDFTWKHHSVPNLVPLYDIFLDETRRFSYPIRIPMWMLSQEKKV
jgi:hypothetical protein